ncbi:hypothetical protein H5410_027176 [Solanum commersonii]|uniref:Uncharacterized protein n=1 Tax=Solanum commersonii TaxID=4109 RepID=A0A9J5Z2N4_SOLCO|nr:hypothetical protein H5410_027176 [Solanum commersonii]
MTGRNEETVIEKDERFQRGYDLRNRSQKDQETRELEEAVIGINLSYKTTATEIKFNHMASHLITYDSIPQATISAPIP